MPPDLFPPPPAERSRGPADTKKENSDRPEEKAQWNERDDDEDEDRFTGYSRALSKPHQSEAMKRAGRRNDLHPYVTNLSLSDVESCVRLEEAAFPENERCSREKFIYRLTKCGELSLGLFSTSKPDSALSHMSTAASAHSPNSAHPEEKGVLLAHVVATKCDGKAVTDEVMDVPPGWHESVAEADRRGHREGGRTIAIHSVAVLPAYQRIGLGKTIMKAYMQRMETSGIADRLALLAHDHLVHYYESLGFVNRGRSEAQFGGGGWNDLVFEFTKARTND